METSGYPCSVAQRCSISNIHAERTLPGTVCVSLHAYGHSCAAKGHMGGSSPIVS